MAINEAYKNLGMTVVLTSVEDYFNEDEEGQNSILDFLSSDYAHSISEGLSKDILVRLINDPMGVKSLLSNSNASDNSDKPSKDTIEYVNSIPIGTEVIDLKTNIVGIFEGLCDDSTDVAKVLKDNQLLRVSISDIVLLSEWIKICEETVI